MLQRLHFIVNARDDGDEETVKSDQMDKTAYPFNGAQPRRSDAPPFKEWRFPMPGAGEPLRGLTLSFQEQKKASEWLGISSSHQFNCPFLHTYQSIQGRG